ncbi:MAG TPA: DNA translocase FtsK [Tepidisphaeraceae bacterium]|nr:DNA translocase FtsK [Tepidisphaeraceae bacterium]
MERSTSTRSVLLFLAAGAWVFLLVSLGSFHYSDWPSHDIYPYGPTQNLCGSVGAWISYYSFVIIGQGAFPLLFFTGICLVLQMCNSRIGDLWMRSAGLLLLTVAFAAAVHHFKPGSYDGFPEGRGGVIGIATATVLQNYFSTVGTRLILLTTSLVGLLLAADDLVLRTPGVVSSAFVVVRDRAPQIKWNFVPLPKLPSLPKFVTKDALIGGPLAALKRMPASNDFGNGPLEIKPAAVAKREKAAAKIAGPIAPLSPEVVVAGLVDDEGEEDNDVIDLSYADDEHTIAAAEAAHVDEADPEPSEAAVIPPPEEQAAVVVVPPPPKLDIVVKLPNFIKPRQTAPPPPKELGDYQLPAWEVLAEAEHGYVESQESFVREQAAILEQALREFSIDAQVVEIDTGPVITMYEISLAPGIKVSAITALSNDIMRALKAESVRIVAPVPGKSTVGIEVPNAQKEKVRLKELMQTAPEAMSKMAVPLFLGKDASGEPLITDLVKMPHCLIAGTTGSGKSVCINTIIMSVMYMQRPDLVKLILVDPKVVEMAPFKDIPHLMCPVINDATRATSVLEWACEKMDERYEFLAEAGVRNLKDYNALSQEELIEKFEPATPEEEAKIPKKLPYIIIIVDELADLMMTSGKEVESYIVRLAQKARAVGIHLILATQRPQATVVTGLIKANMPSKIAFRVGSKMDSRIVLDQNGAEVLLGQGDMLFMPPGSSKPLRGQGTYIDDKEIRDSVKLVKSLAEAQYEPELVQIKATGNIDEEAAKDDLFDDAVRVVLETKRGSVSLLQRRLTIGYSRASRLIEAMAASGIVGDYKGSQAREAMITVEQWDAMRAQTQADAETGMTV